MTIMTLEEQEQHNSYTVDEETTLNSSPIQSLQDIAVFIMLIDAGMHQDDIPVKEITWIDYYTLMDTDESVEY
jgi:hypothetical protein